MFVSSQQRTNFSTYLTYTIPPPCSALRCQPMGTCTGTTCLSSPTSQSFPPFIAPPVLCSTPQRSTYHASTSVFATLVMFRSRGGGGGGGGERVAEMGKSCRMSRRMSVGLGRSGRVRRAHGSSAFELLHGHVAERCVDFHYCILSFRAIGLRRMLVQHESSRESLSLFCRLSSAAQDGVHQSDTGSPFNISVPTRSWVVEFPWFLCGRNAKYLFNLKSKMVK